MMHSRRDTRPRGQGVGASSVPPEMHVSMKVNIVSDGPGGISFSQAVTTPGNYNGIYDLANMPNDKQQLALTYPESSMLPWPTTDTQQKQQEQQTPTEPVVQMPDTSQENLPDSNFVSNVAEKAKIIETKSEKENGEKKRHRHIHKHRHHKKESELLVVSRSQSATSLATSAKASQTEEVIEEDKKHRRSKHKPSSGATGDETSSTSRSRRSNGERGSSARVLEARHKRPQPAERHSLHSSTPPEPLLIPSVALTSAASSRVSEPFTTASGRKMDDLLSEVIINTFADEENGVDNRSRPKSKIPLSQDDANRLPKYFDIGQINDGINVKSIEPIGRRRLLSPHRLATDQSRYPLAVDTPVVPIITTSQAVQSDEPYQSECAIQTEDVPNEEKVEKKKRREKKLKAPSDISEAPPQFQDYLKHIAEATAGLIEASRAVLEQRAQTPQSFIPVVEDNEQQSQPILNSPNAAQLVRVVKETLINDPAIPPLDERKSPEWRDGSTPGLDTSFGRKSGDIPSFDAANVNRARTASPENNASFEGGHRYPHHHHHDEQEQPGAIPGVYYIRTYCAVCGSPRSSRKAIDGMVSPMQELPSPPSTAPPPRPDHFLVHTRPNGGDEIQRTTPIIRQDIPIVPTVPTTFRENRNINDPTMTKVVHESEDIYKSNNGHAISGGVRVPTERQYHAIQDASNQSIHEIPYRHESFERIYEYEGYERQPSMDIVVQPNIEYPVSECASGREEEPMVVSKSKEERLTILEMEEITAQAKARLRELQLIVNDEDSELQIVSPLQNVSPSISSKKSKETLFDRYEHSEEIYSTTDMIDKSISNIRKDELANGRVMIDRTYDSIDHRSPDQSQSTSSEFDLREALEQRRVQLAKQRERFFDQTPVQRNEDAELMDMYERNAVYVPPPNGHQSKGEIFVPIYVEKGTGPTSKRITPEGGFFENENIVGYEEKVETVISKETTISSRTFDEKITDDGDQSIIINSLNSSYDQQPYAVQKRIMPSAKIFQLHTTRPQPSASGYATSDYSKPSSHASVQLFTAPPKIRIQSSTSSESEISLSRKATAGSENRSIDELISSIDSSIPKCAYDGETGSDLSDRKTPTRDDDEIQDPTFRIEQHRSQYDTLNSSVSGGSSTQQRRTNDLYRKALLAQQHQSRNEAPSRGSSINSERSSISNVVRGKGAFTVNEIDRYCEDNLSDYAQGRLTPFDEELAIGGSRSSAHSHDSLASETSFKADTSHHFYGDQHAPESKSISPVGSTSRSKVQQSALREKSFAEIMRERSAARNARLLYYSTFGQQPPALDRIEEQDPDVERGVSRDRTPSTVTVNSEKTMTQSDSIEREGSGIYAVRPSPAIVQNTKRSTLLKRDDAGSSSCIGSELENTDDYSQGRISPMIDIGNDGYATISSYGEERRDTVRTANRVNRNPNATSDDTSGFVGYGKARERVVRFDQSAIEPWILVDDNQQTRSSSSERVVERKRVRQTDL